MAAASDAYEVLLSTDGKGNFQRVARLLISGGTSLLREIFDGIHSPSNLPRILNNPATKKKLRAKLNNSQFHCLYPSPGVCGMSTDFDITLLFHLLRTICNGYLTPPPTGWDCLPVSTDHSLTADLARVKYFRNSVYAHVNEGMQITDDEFPSLWQKISEALVRIAGQISLSKKTEWQEAIANLLKDPLTTEDDRNVQELLWWYRSDMEVKKSIDELKTMTQKIVPSMIEETQEKMETVVQEEAQDIKNQLGEMHQSIDRLNTSAMSSQGVRLRLHIDCKVTTGPDTQGGASEVVVTSQDPHAVVHNAKVEPNTSNQSQPMIKGQNDVEDGGVPSTQVVLNSIASKYLQTLNPSTPEAFSDFLQYMEKIRKVIVVDVKSGSLIVTVECSSLQILDELWDDYCKGHLNEMAQTCLVTEDILKGLGLIAVKLTTTIVYEEYKACREYFLKQPAMASNNTSTSSAPQKDGISEEPKKPEEPNKREEPKKPEDPDKPEEANKPGEPKKLQEPDKPEEANKPEEPNKLQELAHKRVNFGDSPTWTSERRLFPERTLPALAVGVAAGTAGVVAAPLIAGAALGAAGFIGAGVAAGSVAAAVQSSIGSVAAGSFFAACQSAGATGVIGSVATSAIGGITGLAGSAATLAGFNLFGRGSDTVKLLICGSGDGAHVFAGIASAMKDTEVRILSLYQDESERPSTAMQTKDLEVTFHLKGKEPSRVVSKPTMVTKNPEEAMRDVDLVVFMLQASSHQDYLEALKPHIKPETIIVGLPGKPGFEFHIRHVLGDTGRQCTIMNFESLPWVCRTTGESEFGVKCEVLGTMETLLGAIKTGDVKPKNDPIATLRYLLGPLPKLMVSGQLLGVQLMSVNAYLHPSILYGQWEGWDGTPLDQPPLFYNAVTESTADLLSSMSEEIVNIAKLLELCEVMHIYQWFMECYSEDISDKTNLYTAIQTNAAYQGLKHPVKNTDDGKFLPDFTHRYMTEDIPYGLVVIRGIAEIVGVETPNIDKVLTWCQEKMGKEYLVNSKLQGKDIATTRAPQRYGFNTLESIF